MKRHVLRAGAVLAPATLILCSLPDTLAGESSGSPVIEILGLDSPGGPGGITPYAVSNDGNIIALHGDFAGLGPRYPGFWTPETGVEPMKAGDFADMVEGAISADGSTIVGTVNGPGGSRAFRWRGPGTFERFQPPAGIGLTTASAINSDGSRFGGSTIFTTTLEAYFSNAQDELVSLGPSRVGGISATGELIAGHEFTPDGARSWYWTQDTERVYISGLGPSVNARATGVSADGSTIFGSWSALPSRGIEPTPSGFAWSFETGLRDLSNFGESFLQPTLIASTEDGSVIAGHAWDGSFGGPAIWLTGSSAPIDGVEYIKSLGYEFPDGFIAIRITDMTDDGMTFVGTGFYDGENVGWVARVPTPSSLMLFGSSIVAARRRR